MALISPLFLLGVVVLFYLFSFVLFAVIRIATGVSIQRVGYLSLRRISYTLKDGVRIDIRALGLHLHRPTFARPTWISLRLSELKLTVDVKALAEKEAKSRPTTQEGNGSESATQSRNGAAPDPLGSNLSGTDGEETRSRTWKRLTQLKERIKKLHDKIHWLCAIDVEILNSGVVLSDVGAIQVGSLTMAVDTRRKTVDRGRLFRHKKHSGEDQQPAEWMFVMKGILFTPDGKESLEAVDICSLNVHGFLVKNVAGLRDASISLKLGRIHVPYDDIISCQAQVNRLKNMYVTSSKQEHKKKMSFAEMIQELEAPGSREEKIVQTVSDSKEFISSILRGIQEIQMAVSFIGITKEIRTVKPAGKALYLNFAMNEFGIDLFRLDSKSPAHRMYFSSKDVAHQALLAAISIAVSIDDGDGQPERLLYVPMATTTMKSTLPSKTVTETIDSDASERNANILFANLVVTSPSADLDLKHMPIVLGMLQRKSNSPAPGTTASDRQNLLSRLLPKASVRISIQEPVVRVVLPVLNEGEQSPNDYDLLISSVSSISLDLESSHSTAADLHYALTASLRLSSQQFYYQTFAGNRHDLLTNDALELRVQVAASPQVSVVASANLETLSVHMTRHEISKGVSQIVKQLRNSRKGSQDHVTPVSRLPLLRRFPSWLTQAQFKGSNLEIEVAGVDEDVSPDLRGIALQLESWSIDYKVQKNVGFTRQKNLHRALSYPFNSDDGFLKTTLPKASTSAGVQKTDGRRVTAHVQGFQGFIVEGHSRWEPQPFASMPRFEVAMSTSSDAHGNVFHVNCHMKALYMQYSLYRHYAAGVAETVIKRAFFGRNEKEDRPTHDTADASSADAAKQNATTDILTLDVKAGFIQIKATMPSDPRVMLRVHGAEFGRHRWGAPFAKTRRLRMYAQAPSVKTAWASLVNLKSGRIDLRSSRRKIGTRYVDEKSVDIVTELLHLTVPHQLVLHKIFDNFVNTVKATEQLSHRFKTGTNEYILKKAPEEPKQVPRISFRSRNLIFALEDGSFDWKLGMIYRVGLREQKQRLARQQAYELKVKTLEEAYRRGSSRTRARGTSPKPRERSKLTKAQPKGERSGSVGPGGEAVQASQPETRGRQMRYDTEAAHHLTGTANISTKQAELKLKEHNSSSWKRRIDYAIKHQTDLMENIHGLLVDGTDESEDSVDNDEELIIAANGRPGLMVAFVHDLHVVADKPSFPLPEYPHFLHKVGKGMPYDTQYSLLIPMNLQINMGESRVNLRNYPLPLLHVPALKPGQSSRVPCWSLKTDFVIAEEYRDSGSTKRRRVEVIPTEKFFRPQPSKKGFFIDVRRTVSPVKTYSDVDVSINTNNPTSITWGTSYQPAIQEMMQVIENFTKPQVDPSERVGFWDKIRLIFHSRVRIAWRGDGDVHLRLKGTRDPYVVTGYGAGFIMCFRNNVRWDIHQDDDPKKFMTVSCGEYVLAIPDYSRQARDASRNESGRDTESSVSSSKRNTNAHFQKVVMKLSGNVRWMAGLVFERDVEGGGRSFESSPHYNVTLTTPEHAKSVAGRAYDAFRGFRSHYIHLSIAVLTPVDRDWSVTNTKPSSSYNSLHLTPRFFTHFFDWWSQFSGVMALPIRQGKLFPGVEKSTKKFGRHLVTMKYNLLLSPFFIAHIYKHKDAEDYSEDTVGATGLKLRIDSFMLDLHQRREEFASQGKGNLGQARTTGMKINNVQLDFITADLRAVSASIAGTTADDVRKAPESELVSLHEQMFASPDYSRFTIPDNDFLWIDMDDFVELDWILPSETHPETKIMPLAFAPRFTYFRQTDQNGMIAGDPTRSSKFGDEPTHFCIMSHDNDPRRVQCDLIRDRIIQLDEQIEGQQSRLGDHELHVIREIKSETGAKDSYDSLRAQIGQLERKRSFLQSMLDLLLDNIKRGQKANNPIAQHPPELSTESETDQSARIADLISDFNNRFIIHNIQLKWNNSLRNIILRYVHQVSQRRGFVYYMSRRAVKFILDIVEERQRNREQRPESDLHTPTGQSSSSPSFNGAESDVDLEERIQDLLKDGKTFVDADDPHQKGSNNAPNATADIGKDIAEDYAARNSYHVRLIAPQIQLQSEKNPKSVALVTGKGMELKVIQVMDKSRVADEVSGLVQRRFSVEMDGVQFFVTNQRTLQKFIHLYTANRYGCPKGSAWPPWAPLEVNFDSQIEPFGWSRIVQETSATLRYDKYNTLRLKYNDEVSQGDAQNGGPVDDSESRIDHLWVEFPQIRAICDSVQYYSMYVIVLDLLLYSEPLEKSRSERLEKIMLATDFSDLTNVPQMVESLQERIRQLEEIKGHFQLHAKFLDRQGWQDRLSIEEDLASCEDELFFTMKAITTAQQRYDDRSQAQSNGVLRWFLSSSEIVWHLMREQNEPLMEIQLKNASYDRTDNRDGSNRNTMEIERIHGLNLLPDALYPQMIRPYFEDARSEQDNIKMLKVQWYMLEAIAGIPVLDQFEVNLFPLKIQLEREIGKKVFDYIFPGNSEGGTGASPFLIKHMTPMDDDDEDGHDDGVSENGTNASSGLIEISNQKEAEPPSTRPGSIELRMKPTLTLSDNTPRPNTSSSGRPRLSVTPSDGNSHLFRFFNKSRSSTHLPQPERPSSSTNSINPQSSTRSRQESRPRMQSRTSTVVASSARAADKGSAGDETIKPRNKYGLKRTTSNTSSVDREKSKNDKNKANDDLTEMMSRASNYMTLAYVKLPSVVLCLSYKGRGERNIEDVHDFVFRMPALEYRNKTWSNLDLALRLKTDVIKALISHTGAIIGNKFSHHRPSKRQQSRLREKANASTLLPSTNTLGSAIGRKASHMYHGSTSPRNMHDSSSVSEFGTPMTRTASDLSSFDERRHDVQGKAMSEGSSLLSSDQDSSSSMLEMQYESSPRQQAEQNDERRDRSATITTNGSSLLVEREQEREREEKPRDTRRNTVLNLGKKVLNKLN
jgi:hypothetical protein